METGVFRARVIWIPEGTRQGLHLAIAAVRACPACERLLCAVAILSGPKWA